MPEDVTAAVHLEDQPAPDPSGVGHAFCVEGGALVHLSAAFDAGAAGHDRAAACGGLEASALVEDERRVSAVEVEQRDRAIDAAVDAVVSCDGDADRHDTAQRQYVTRNPTTFLIQATFKVIN